MFVCAFVSNVSCAGRLAENIWLLSRPQPQHATPAHPERVAPTSMRSVGCAPRLSGTAPLKLFSARYISSRLVLVKVGRLPAAQSQTQGDAGLQQRVS